MLNRLKKVIMKKTIRDSFVFYRSFYEASLPLNKEQKADLFTAICELALNQNVTKTEPMVNALLTLIKPNIEANNKRYENGMKGGRPKTKVKPKRNQSKTKDKPNVDVNVDVDVDVDVNENKKEIIKEKEMLVIESYFKRRPSTPWSDKEIQLFKKLGTIDPDDLKLMTTRYESKDKYLRRDLKTLLNNWHGELDRARQNNIIVQRKYVPLQTMTGLRDA